MNRLGISSFHSQESSQCEFCVRAFGLVLILAAVIRQSSTAMSIAVSRTMCVNGVQAPETMLTSSQGGIIDENEEEVVRQLNDSVKRVSGSSVALSQQPGADLTRYTASFVDPVKAAEDLQSFANLNESRLYKLLKTCLDPQTDLKSLVKSSVCRKR